MHIIKSFEKDGVNFVNEDRDQGGLLQILIIYHFSWNIAAYENQAQLFGLWTGE